MRCKVAYVRLPESVYGNEAMSRLARRTLADHPEVDAVHVGEHGGWWLMFARGDGPYGLMIVGTANDSACLSRAALDFCAKFDSSENACLDTPDHERSIA